MKLLLDTHIWLWSISEPHRLSRRVARELDNPENQLWLSPVSIWETLLLYRKGRIKIFDDFITWVDYALSKVPVNEAPFTLDVARMLPKISLPHADPADLFLVASAAVFDLVLVTADRTLIHAPEISVMAN
ncbi:MAG TPA: type II toxin-antitoxin system VapC family toxin [Terriglobales bacterium]|nr:type II toxin-antitoxin system VapC family toxin [Terriglobales bacterium]